jgi:hypothetical protein
MFFVLLFVYICIAVGGSIIRDVRFGSTNRFNPHAFYYLFKARTCISTTICRGFCVFNDLMREVVVDVGGMVDHRLNIFCA